MKESILFVLFLQVCFFTFGQSEKDIEEAKNIATEAIVLMDNNEHIAAISMLKKSAKLDPTNYVYPYEISYSYVIQKDYKNAIKTLKKVVKLETTNYQCYTLLGNTYDFSGEPQKAIETYEEGLRKFPSAGQLYFERGLVYGSLQEYNKALASWEEGVIADSNYPSNYHAATQYYCSYTSEIIWGVLYGELFMNIERSSKRTEAMSKLLYDTYQSSIKVDSLQASVTFSKEMQISLPAEGEEMKIPFSMVYEMNMATSILSEMTQPVLNIASFNRIRTNFITGWYANENEVLYPNILFDWQKKLIDLNYFESYNYWLFMKGNQEEFDHWYKENKTKFDQFIDWYSANPLEINQENNFHTLQY